MIDNSNRNQETLRTQEKNEKIRKRQIQIKKYLELENVSVLTGAGCSYHLGCPTIGKIPDEIQKKHTEQIKKYFPENTNPSLEDFLNCLQADRFIKEHKKENNQENKEGDNQDNKDINTINTVIKAIQNWLLENCNTNTTTIIEEERNKLEKNRYYYHEHFIKKLLQRPNNLRRVNLFTTNYDMAFDYALDNLGVHYINGFMGVHHRYFKPEVYDYDLYYPGQSVSGKVHRAEKVLKYYKLHGSLSWVSCDKDIRNTYGIKEIQLESNKTTDNKEISDNNEMLIYPCTNKKSFTLDLPYSELFRQFSNSIVQPQSVLFCIGYSFNDEHINDIIKQALAIPSFTLFVVNYNPKQSNQESNTDENFFTTLKDLEKADKRIIILDEGQSTFINFVMKIMPDLYELDEEIQVNKTIKEISSQGNENSL